MRHLDYAMNLELHQLGVALVLLKIFVIIFYFSKIVTYSGGLWMLMQMP